MNLKVSKNTVVFCWLTDFSSVFNCIADGHTTTTTATTNAVASANSLCKSEQELQKDNTEENSPSLLNRALFIWFDKFVLYGQNREFSTKNIWHLDPEYR